MLDRLIRKKKPTKKINLKEDFYTSHHHNWIKTDRFILESFSQFFDELPSLYRKKLKTMKPIRFVQASGKYSCAFTGSDDFHIIIVFPELKALLKSTRPEEGLAIIAHEIGHLIMNHSKRNIDPLEAQIEADDVAYKLGYGLELQDFLLAQKQTIETKVRIARLTQSHMIDLNKDH